MPAVINKSSSFADEGTALHTLIAGLITGAVMKADIQPGYVIEVDEDDKKFTLTLDNELIRNCVRPALTYYDQQKAAKSRMEPLGYVEEEVSFPGIEGAFGTADLVMRFPDQNRTRLTDWKFGAGVGVKAVYDDVDPETGEVFEVVNEQLLFYIACVRNEMPEMFSGRRDDLIELVIFQPRAPNPDDAVTLTTVTHQEIDDFEQDLAAALERSNDDDAPIRAGRWCEFAPCASNCPLKLRPLLDLQALQPPRLPAQGAPEPEHATYRAVLLAILSVADVVEEVIAEAKAQAHTLIEAGQKLEGWKVVPKRGTRKWTKDEAGVIRAMKKLGVDRKDLYATAFASPAGAEKLLPHGVKLPEGLAVMVPGNGTTLAPDKDKRPPVVSLQEIAKIVASAGTGG